MPDWLTAVWSAPAFIIATSAGVLLGSVVVTRPLASRYVGLGTRRGHGWLVGLGLAFAGLLFYTGQTVEAITSGDPGWPRVVSRFSIWLVYSAAAGIGVWLALRTWHR